MFESVGHQEIQDGHTHGLSGIYPGSCNVPASLPDAPCVFLRPQRDVLARLDSCCYHASRVNGSNLSVAEKLYQHSHEMGVPYNLMQIGSDNHHAARGNGQFDMLRQGAGGRACQARIHTAEMCSRIYLQQNATDANYIYKSRHQNR